MEKFENSEFFGSDFIIKPAQDGETLLKVLVEIEKQLIKVAAAQKNIIQKGSTDNAKGFRETEGAVKKLSEAEKVHAKITRDRLSLEAKLKASNSKRVQQNVQLSEQLRIQNQINKQIVRENAKVVGAYAAQSATLRRLVKEYQNLAASERANTKEARALLRQITQLDTKLKAIDKTAGRGHRTIGLYGTALGRLKTNFLSVASAAGVMFGVFGAVRVIGSATNTIRNFEKENAILAGVLDKTSDEIVELTDDAERLGSITAKTATEVTSLQIAYSRLGFTQSEILALTEGTINGSIALNAELSETASLVGAVVNTFEDFDVTDAATILDQLTAATQQSALNFTRLQTSLPIVAGAANAAGIPFSRLLALLGKLADAGIDASMSSTALRNIFIESAKQGLSYEKILEKIANSTDKLTAANDEFGKRAAVSSSIVAEQIGQVELLEESLNKAGGAAERVAKVHRETLDGSLLLLRSAYDGWILSLNKGGRITDVAARALRFLAENFRTVIAVIGIAIAAWASYRITVFAARNAMIAYNAIMRGAAIVTALFTGGLKKATIAVRAFNVASKANVLGVLISLLTTAAGLFLLYRDNADQATEAQKELNEAQRESIRIQESFMGIEGRVAEARRLSKNQLKTLLQDIDAEIRANEDKEAKIIGSEERIAKAAEGIRRNAISKIADLGQELAVFLSEDQLKEEKERLSALGSSASDLSRITRFNERKDYEESRRNQIFAEIEFQNTRISAARTTAELISEEEEGVAEKVLQENIVVLQSYRAIILERLNGIKSVSDANEKAKKLDLIDREDLTDLQKLKVELEQINSARERLATGTTDQEHRAFDALTDQKEILEEIIELIERRLSGDNNIEEQQLKSLDAIKKKTEENDKAFRKAHQKRIDDEIEAEKRAAELRNAIITVAGDLLDEKFTRNIEGIDEQLDNSFQRVDQLIANARNARLATGESVAFERKQQAELERDRERNRQRQEKARAISAVLQSFNANDGDLQRTIADTFALRGLASTLVGFFDGTDNVQDSLGKPQLSGRDGHIVRLDGKEQVWSDKDQAQAGYRTRQEVIDLVSSVDKGMINSIATGGVNVSVDPSKAGFNDQRMIDHLKKINGTLKSAESNSDQVHFDYLKGMFTHERRRGNRITRNHRRLN